MKGRKRRQAQSVRSAVAILSALSVRTNRIHLGTCVLNPYTINPAEIAMAAGTLDELSEGRFILKSV